MKRTTAAARTWNPVHLLRTRKPGCGKPSRKAFRPALEHLETRLAPANVDVLSFHNDTSLTAQHLQEEVLTPANVNATGFGKFFSQSVDGPVYAQPLYKAALAFPGGGGGNGPPPSRVGAFDPATATWYLRDSTSSGAADLPFQYGAPGWVGVTGDWNGDGTVGVGAFDPATATWYLRDSPSAGAPDHVFQYGGAGWVPVVGKWAGSGPTTVGVVDPATTTWYLRNSNSAGAADAVFQYGGAGWTPVAGDWTGDGTTTPGAFDPQTATWYLRDSNSAGAPDVAAFQYGGSGWKPVVGDWSGRGADTVGVVDPATGTWYLRDSNSAGAPDVTPFAYGLGTWQPLAGQPAARTATRSVHNAVFVATEHDSVYAFDADSNQGASAAPLWRTNFLNPAAGITTIGASELGNPDIVPEIGITGTPVIDAATGTLYVLPRTREVRSGVVHYVEKLHALDLTTGAEKFGGPYAVGDTTLGGPDGGFTDTTAISVPGNGDGSSGGVVRFNAAREMQRPALQLVNGVVYVAWASQSDNRPYHGWVIGFDKTTLQPVKVFNTTPNASAAGIWESGGGVSADPQGNLYFALGNGFDGPNLAFDPAHGNYSESVLKLSATGQLSVTGSFTPFDWQTLDTQDADLGSGGAMLLPDFVGSTAHQHLMVETGKSGKIYLLDRDDLGGFTPGGPDRVVQVVQNQPGVWGNPAFFRTGANSGIVYYHGSGADLRGYRISNGQFDTANVLHSNQTSGFPGTQPVVSANGIASPTSPTNGITWELQVDNFAAGGIGLGGNPTTPAVLRAWNATNFATELYDSAQASPRDRLGNAVKFTTLAVSNGHVFAPTQSTLEVFGLFPANTAVPAARANLQGALQAAQTGLQIRLTWTNPNPVAGAVPTGIRILRSTDGTNFTQLGISAGTDTSYTDVGPLTIGQTYAYRVVATNQQGDALPSNTVNVVVPIASPVLGLAGVASSSVGLSWTGVANDHYLIERSTNGGPFAAVTTVPAFQTTYSDTGRAPGIYAYRVHAFNVGPTAESLSNIQGATVGAVVDHNSGFANPTDLTANGNAFFASDTTLRLTGADAQTGSAFSNTRMTVSRFTTTFEIRLHEGTQPDYADGVTFVVQANAPTALGQAGSGLGSQGIGHSVAIKFATFQYAGDPSTSSTGVFINGVAPRGGASTLPTVLLNSQDQKDVTLTYDGTTLSETILDVPRGMTFTTSFAVDIPGAIGSDTAYVGFTGTTGSPGGTRSFWEIQDVVNWRFTSQAALPGAPSNLRLASFASKEIDLAWNANSYNETAFRVERSPDGAAWAEIDTTTGNTYKDVGLAGGAYFYRVRASNAGGSSPYSNVLRTGLPGPVLTQDQDVGTPGDPALPGSATFANGVYTVNGSGHDIWDQADGFHFVYKPLIGDGTVVARVVTVGNTDFFAKAGVMIRESLDANSRDAYVTMTPHNQVQFLQRLITGANAQGDGPGGVPLPIWVRVQRQGSNFTGSWSPDGVTWNPIATVAIAMGPTAYVGLVASSHNNGVVSTSTFDNVSVVPAVLQTSHLDVSANVAAVNPGRPVTVTVQALDPFNNPAPGYRGTVHLTTSDPTVTPPDYTFTAADNGRHTFTVTFGTLGRQTVFAVDTGTPIVVGGTAVLVTNQAVLGSLVISGLPSSVVAGVANNFTVTARDAQGNTFTGYRGTVHFASSDPRAQLPADYPFTAADSGVHNFTATLNTPGTQSITVTDQSAGVSGTQSDIQVVAPPSLTTVGRSAAVLNPGGTLTVSATFTDPVTQTHTAVVSWGDATTDTTLPLGAGVLTFSTNHTYAPAGNFEIHVAVTGANGGSDAAILTVSAASVAPPAGLVGWWPGDGTNPTAAADIAGGNPGTLVNGATHAPGLVGNAFSFNGTNQWVLIPTGSNIPVGNPTYTLMAWIKPTAAGNGGIIGYGNYGTPNQTNAFRLLDDGTGHLNFRHYWWGNDLDAFTAIPANGGAWHLAAAEFDGTTRRVLLDGNVIATDTPAPGHNVPNTANFAVGGVDFFGGVANEVFNGLIDEPQVYNRALTQAEVQSTFSAGAAGQIKGVRVQAVPPPVITSVSRSAAVINEGGTFTVSGTFTDPVMGQTHQVTVSWGDNTASTTVPLAVGVTAFSANHPYGEEGNFTAQITVTAANVQSDTVNLPVSATSVASPSGLVSWWTGDGTNPTTAPDIAGANPGALTNGATHAAGEVGNAFSFNGTNQYLDLPTGAGIPVGNATYTLTAWIKPTAAGNGGIIGYGNYGNNNQVNAFRVLDNGTGHLNLLNYWWGNDLEADTSVPAAGAWHLATAEFDGTTRRILLDGQVVAVDTPTGHNVPNTANFRIASTNLGEYFNGLIDEPQVYNRALTTAEVQGIFNAGSAGQIKGVRGADPAVVPTGGFTATAYAGVASALQPVGVFTDPGGFEALADYSATINWGDNTTPSAATPSFNAGTGVFTVQGSHPYTQVGHYPITVTFHHDAAPDATATSAAQVFAPVLHVAGFPPTVVAGSPGSFTVTAQDLFGATLAGYGGTVHFTSSDGQATLPGDATLTNGTGTFSATLKTAGTQSLTAIDTATAGVTGSQSGIVVTAGAAAALALTGLPVSVSGDVAGFRVTARDAYGNTALGYRGTVHFSSSDPFADLPRDYAFTAADGGQHDFGTELVTVGTDSLTATDTASAGLSATQSVVVTPASFTVTGPSSVTAGEAGTFEATAYDALGNVATGYTGTTHFTSSDGQAVLPPDYAFTAADAGVHDFTVTLKTAGFQTVTVADTVTPAASTGTGYVLVNPAAAATLSVSGYPSPAQAGTGGYVLVQARDPYGNVATGYTGTAHLSSTDPQAYLEPDYTFTADDAGQHYSFAVLYTAGTRSLTATDTTTASIAGAQAGIAVAPADAAYFIVSGFPDPATPGAPGAFTVWAVDAYGNVATGYRGTVHFTSSDAQATLPGDYPFTATDQGGHPSTATLRTPGLQSLTATDLASGATGTQDNIDVLNPPRTGGAGAEGGKDGRASPGAADGGRDRFGPGPNVPGVAWADAIDALLAGLREKRRGVAGLDG